MRKLFASVAAISVALTSSAAVAHPGNLFDEEYERAPTIPELAKDAIYKLISQSKLPASWASAKFVSSTERTTAGAKQLVLVFRNDAIRIPATKSLYVVMTAGGQFVSANHRLK